MLQQCYYYLKALFTQSICILPSFIFLCHFKPVSLTVFCGTQKMLIWKTVFFHTIKANVVQTKVNWMPLTVDTHRKNPLRHLSKHLLLFSIENFWVNYPFNEAQNQLANSKWSIHFHILHFQSPCSPVRSSITSLLKITVVCTIFPSLFVRISLLIKGLSICLLTAKVLKSATTYKKRPIPLFPVVLIEGARCFLINYVNV